MRIVGQISIVAAATTLALSPVGAQPSRSLAQCEKTMGKEMTKYSGAVQKALTKCLDRIAKEVLGQGDPVADAAKACVTVLRKLENSEQPEKTLSARFRDKVGKFCDPAYAGRGGSKADHTETEATDPSAANGLRAGQLAAYCGAFGGDGTLDSVSEWIACADAAAVCNALQQTAAKLPKATGWFADLAVAIGALGTEVRYSDAQAAALAIRARIDPDLDGIAEISCGPPAHGCGNGVVDDASESCDGDDLNGESCSSLGYEAAGGLGCTSDCQFDFGDCRTANKAPRFRDNGDGTATDIVSGLQWELKNDANGLHRVDDPYTWCADTAPSDSNCDAAEDPFDGTAATAFLAALNSEPCFAGHCDWRLPTIYELAGLLPIQLSCDTITPCIDPELPGFTAAGTYWSSTASASSPWMAWHLDTTSGDRAVAPKNDAGHVRAVRGGW